MNSKTSYTLCTPPSHTSCEKLSNSVFDSDIAKRLYLAQQKLRPVIDDVMRTATENLTAVNYKTNKSHYLTVEQYEDAILASQILRDVDKIISEKQNDMRMKKYNLDKFNLGKENIKTNKSGKIYVDTSILIQLIELHKTLGDIINNTQKAYTEASNDSDVSSHSQIEVSNTSVTYNSTEGRDLSSNEKFNIILMNKNPGKSKQKIRINVLNRKSKDTKLKIMENKSSENITPEALPLRPYSLGKSIVVMSAHALKTKKSDEQKLSNAKKLSTLPEERTSNSETNISDAAHSIRKIKSTGSIKSDGNKSKVTDVVGARKIILNCLYDLKKVRSFLERIDIDADVQINTAVLDTNIDTENAQTTDNEQPHPEVRENIETQETTDTEQSHPDVKENVEKQERQHQQDEEPKSESQSDAPETPLETLIKPKPIQRVKENVKKEKLESGKDKRDCCCDATYASDVPMELMLDAGDENASKLIICIKGKTEEEGDVQIIIRQCSECKNLGENEEVSDGAKTSAFASGKPSEDEQGFTSESASHVQESPQLQDDATNKEAVTSDQQPGMKVLYDSTNPPTDVELKTSKDELQKEIPQGDEYSDTTSAKSSERMAKTKPGLNVLFDPEDPSKSIVEPTKNVQGEEVQLAPENQEAIPPEVEKEKSGLNVIFDPVDPSRSIVEPTKKGPPIEQPTKDTIPPEKVTPRGSQSIHKKTEEEGDGCSKIKLYETTNLCFSTDDGQELVISLTVRPKVGGTVPKLSLKDIFSESTSKSEQNEQHTQEHINQIFGSDTEITVGLQDKQQYERFIPLSRTKICSSLEFDVSVMETKLRNKGIKHVNPGIVVRLKELGVNNLLRACRPVKCGRAAVLNEKLRKGIPYSASLTSLPLEKSDGDIIDQSLEMSLNKTKHSSIKNKRKTLAYCTEFGNITNKMNLTNKNMQISFVHISTSNHLALKNQSKFANDYVKKKLNYYINLVHDIEIQSRSINYEIYFFEIKKYSSGRNLQKSGTNPLLRNNRCVVDNLPNDLKNSNKEKAQKFLSPNCTLKENIQSSSKYEMKRPISNLSQPPKNKTKVMDNLELKRQNCKEKKKFVSKIPIYKYNKRSNIDENKLTRKSQNIYDVSLQSLPRGVSGGIKEIDANHNNEQKMNPVEKLGNILINRNRTYNKNWISNCEMVQNTIGKITYADQESDYDKMSDDSLELYFNNFFRDKYFSKLALCQKQCSNRSLKPRKKKSEYHCSKSQSHTYISDSTENLEVSSNISNQTQTSELLSNSKTQSFSKNSIKNEDESFKISQSVMFQFTRLFCEYWVKQMLLSQNGNNKKLKSVENVTSSSDIWRNEIVQEFFRSIKQNILEETLENTFIRLQSQPNVEAGMDNETPSFQFNFTPRPSGDVTTHHYNKNVMPFKSIEDILLYQPKFQHNKTNKTIGINNAIGNNSCDNFENVIVTFESNTCINEFPKLSPRASHKRMLPPTNNRLVNNCLSANLANIKANTEKQAGDNSWNEIDQDALQYLVYQNYFSSPSMLQRVIEKSKSLFKSNCGNGKRKATTEYTNDEGLPSLKEKHLDTTDYSLGSETSPDKLPQKIYSQCKIIFPVHKLSKLRDHAKEYVKDAECKICGCSISKCESKSTGGHCSCKKLPKPDNKETKTKSKSKTPPNKIASKELKPKKCLSKKSVGMICFPKNADISVCVKLGSATRQAPTRQCYCIKCEKRSDDGSCYCSHCLGIFDKSVGKKPSNKEIATQSIDSKSNETSTGDSQLSTAKVPKKENGNSKVDDNIVSGIPKERVKPELYTEIKPQPDIKKSENNDIVREALPEDNKPEGHESNEVSSDQNQKPGFLKVRTDLYPDQNVKDNDLSTEENKPPINELQSENTNNNDSVQEESIKKEDDLIDIKENDLIDIKENDINDKNQENDATDTEEESK